MAPRQNPCTLSRWLRSLTLALLLPGAASAADDHIRRVDRTGCTLWLDGIDHGALRFRYNAQHDSGDFLWQDQFRFDPDVPPDCQQLNTDSYHTDPPAPVYQRGHLVPANHLDDSEKALAESCYMINILPQTATFNTGAWQRTEEIIECYRDGDELLVIGGVVCGNDATNDHFVESHGIRTPDACWKVVMRGNGRTIAWRFPNSVAAMRANLDKYLTTTKRLEKVTGAKVPEGPEEWRKKRPRTSWKLPEGCSLN